MKIMIGKSIWRSEDIEHAVCARELGHLLVTSHINYIDLSQIGDAYIARSRNHVAMAFLKSDCDVLFITDGDMVFEAPDIVRMCQTVSLSDSYKVVGGAYVVRQPDKNGHHRLAIHLREGDMAVFEQSNRSLMEVDYLGTGCLVVHRTVFESLAKTMKMSHKLSYSDSTDDYYPFFGNFMEEISEGRFTDLSEDYAFAKRARDAGFKSYLDPSVRLGHVGTYIYTLGDMDRAGKDDGPVAVRIEKDEQQVLRAGPSE